MNDNSLIHNSLFIYILGSCVLRIPVLYGNIEYLNESAVTCLLNLLKTKELSTVSNYERRYPSHVKDISRILCDLISKINKVRFHFYSNFIKIFYICFC